MEENDRDDRNKNVSLDRSHHVNFTNEIGLPGDDDRGDRKPLTERDQALEGIKIVKVNVLMPEELTKVEIYIDAGLSYRKMIGRANRSRQIA